MGQHPTMQATTTGKLRVHVCRYSDTEMISFYPSFTGESLDNGHFNRRAGPSRTSTMDALFYLFIYFLVLLQVAF